MISAILLCAGESKRLGAPKALLTLDAKTSSKTFVRNAIEQIFKSGVEELVIVTGAYQKEIELEIRKYFDSLIRLSKLKLVHNDNYKKGMMTSIQRGVKALSKESDAFFISLVDLPFVESKDYRLLAREFRAGTKKLFRAKFAGQPTHPVLISTEFKNEILKSEPVDQGCAFLFKKYPDEILWCKSDSDRGCIDIDSMKAYRAHIAV